MIPLVFALVAAGRGVILGSSSLTDTSGALGFFANCFSVTEAASRRSSTTKPSVRKNSHLFYLSWRRIGAQMGAVVRVGPVQYLAFVEGEEPLPEEYDGHHICVYLTEEGGDITK